MTPIGGPQIHDGPGGWGGYQLIAESHISLHSENLFLIHLDIFSCMAFPEGEAIHLAINLLGLERVQTQRLERGWLTRPLVWCGDHLCPCQDGDACHYKDTPGSPAMVFTGCKCEKCLDESEAAP